MLFKDHVGCIICVIVMFILGAAMAIVGALVSGQPITYVSFMHSWGTAFLFNVIAAMILPVAEWGFALCKKVGLKPGSAGELLLSTLVLNGVFVTCVTLGMMTVNVGFNGMYWPAFIHLWPILFVAGYIVALISTIIAGKIAASILKGRKK